MDSNLVFLRNYISNYVMRELCNKPCSFFDLLESIYQKTAKAYFLKDNALELIIEQLFQDKLISTEGNLHNLQGCVFSLTNKGQRQCEPAVTTWELSKERLDIFFKDSTVYNASEVEDKMYGRTGIALIKDKNKTIIDFYYNDVFSYMPHNSYKQLPIDVENTQQNTKRAEAMAKLGIGNVNISTDTEEESLEIVADEEPLKEVAHTSPPPRSKQKLNEYLKFHDNKEKDMPYRSTLDSMFGTRQENVPVAVADTPMSEMTIATSGYADLKERLMRMGYKLKPYIKQTSTSYYSLNFVYSNKLKRDCYTLLYFLMLIQIFVGYFFVDKYVKVGFAAYIITAAVLITVPLYGWIMYLLHPDKRVRANFNFKLTLSGTLMLYVNLLQITVLLGFFAFRADIHTTQTMILPILYPAVLLLNMPFAVILFNFLYKTERYHLK